MVLSDEYDYECFAVSIFDIDDWCNMMCRVQYLESRDSMSLGYGLPPAVARLSIRSSPVTSYCSLA